MAKMHFRPYAAYSSTPGPVVTGIAPFAVSPGQPLPGQEWLVVGHEPGYSPPQAKLLGGGGYPGTSACLAGAENTKGHPRKVCIKIVSDTKHFPPNVGLLFRGKLLNLL